MVREGDTIKRMSKQRAAIKSLVNKAMKGDARAFALLLPLAERYIVNQLDAHADEELSGSDAEILERFLEAQRASRPAEDARAGKPDDDEAGAAGTKASTRLRRTRFPGKREEP